MLRREARIVEVEIRQKLLGGKGARHDGDGSR